MRLHDAKAVKLDYVEAFSLQELQEIYRRDDVVDGAVVDRANSPVNHSPEVSVFLGVGVEIHAFEEQMRCRFS